MIHRVYQWFADGVEYRQHRRLPPPFTIAIAVDASELTAAMERAGELFEQFGARVIETDRAVEGFGRAYRFEET